MKRRLHLVVSKHFEDDQHEDNDDDDDIIRQTSCSCHEDDSLQKPIPRQVILVDHHHHNNNDNNSVPTATAAVQPISYFDRELERQTHDFLTDRLLRGSDFFGDNIYPERQFPRFSQNELVLGEKLGGGEFGKVYTIESFDQRKQNMDVMPGAIVMDNFSGGGGDRSSSSMQDRQQQLQQKAQPPSPPPIPHSSTVMAGSIELDTALMGRRMNHLTGIRAQARVTHLRVWQCHSLTGNRQRWPLRQVNVVGITTQ
jgi:hypothetical protein